MSIATLSRFARGFGFAALFAVCFAPSAGAQDAAPGPEQAPSESYVAIVRQAGIKLIDGPATYRLGDVAEIRLPAGYHGVEPGSIKRFYEFSENRHNGNEVGVVVGPRPNEFLLVFDYDGIGYVKDDDKDALDADKLMKAMTEGEKEANEARKKQGWNEIKIAGWAQPPHYDAKTNNLTWAVRLTSSGDNHQAAFLNESIRLLGRGGVMNVTLVTGPETHVADSATTGDLLATHFGYVEGQRYAEFKEGDKIAEYGLAALVLGGAGAAAFKLGFFQKFWKFLVFGGIAVAGFFKKMWARLTGREA